MIFFPKSTNLQSIRQTCTIHERYIYIQIQKINAQNRYQKTICRQKILILEKKLKSDMQKTCLPYRKHIHRKQMMCRMHQTDRTKKDRCQRSTLQVNGPYRTLDKHVENTYRMQSLTVCIYQNLSFSIYVCVGSYGLIKCY